MLALLRRVDPLLCLLVLAMSFVDSLAQAPQQMKMTRPWVQLKATDANGAVTYRIGGVFTEPGDQEKRLSVTFVCQPGGNLTFFVVHQHVPRQTGKAAKIHLQIDGEPFREFQATRDRGQGLASYSVTNSSEVIPLIQAMAGGQTLHIQLDEYGYQLSLTGFKAELADLQKVCPY